jgi:hypothetical protein
VGSNVCGGEKYRVGSSIEEERHLCFRFAIKSISLKILRFFHHKARPRRDWPRRGVAKTGGCLDYQ